MRKKIPSSRRTAVSVSTSAHRAVVTLFLTSVFYGIVTKIYIHSRHNLLQSSSPTLQAISEFDDYPPTVDSSIYLNISNIPPELGVQQQSREVMLQQQEARTASEPSSSSLSQGRPTTLPGRLFYCLRSCGAQRIFPEYSFQEKAFDFRRIKDVTSNDILIVPFSPPAIDSCFRGRKKPGRLYRQGALSVELFPGKVLWVNGEYEGDVFREMPFDGSDRLFQIGPYPPQTNFHPHSMQLYYFVLHLSTALRDNDQVTWNWLFDPKQRRNNTGKFKGVAYLTSNCVQYRQDAARALSTILPVYYGNGCSIVNTDESQTAIHVPSKRGGWINNFEEFHDYKYCLVMESTFKDGYITEKLLNAFLGGCLPIYYGTREVFNLINSDSFLFYDVMDPQSTLDKIAYLEENPEAYQEMLSAPILKNGNQTVDEYFSLFPEVGDGSLNRRLRVMMGLAPYQSIS